MTEEQIIAMLSEIIEEVDYDIWKERYDYKTAESSLALSEEVDLNYDILVAIVEKHMGGLPRSVYSESELREEPDE